MLLGYSSRRKTASVAPTTRAMIQAHGKVGDGGVSRTMAQSAETAPTGRLEEGTPLVPGVDASLLPLIFYSFFPRQSPVAPCLSTSRSKGVRPAARCRA